MTSSFSTDRGPARGGFAPVGPPAARRPGLMMLLTQPVTWASTVCMGLMAGLFLAFAIAVMPGLARGDDRTFVIAMQSINRAIENFPFAVVFVGSFAFTGAAAFMQNRLGLRAAGRWILAALALYVVALIVTFVVNIPLNDALASVADTSTLTQFAAARADFEGPWVAAHAVRTIACVIALICLTRSLSLREKGKG